MLFTCGLQVDSNRFKALPAKSDGAVLIIARLVGDARVLGVTAVEIATPM